MKKFKRVLSAVIALSLILTICQSAVFAAKNNTGKKNTIKKNVGISYIVSRKSFDDIGIYTWAERAIEKLRLKGLIRGKQETKFAPQSDVTKLESVIMALRVMGWEGEVTGQKSLPSRYKGKKVQEWAIGYVAVAFAKGILDEVDLLYFDPDAPAARHEVAKYVIRALGYADEAEDNMNQKLPFIDAAAVPQGSVGYVYLINKMGLMIGNNGIFNPMGTLTRAEMAVLFSRLDDKVDNDLDESEYEGIIENISSSRIKIKVDGELLTFHINQDDVKVYKNDRKVPFSTLKKNDLVLIQLDDDEVVYIEILDKSRDEEDKIISKYTGDVTNIDTVNNTITIQLDTMLITFKAINNIEVYFKNRQGEFEDIVKGDTITVIVDTRNRAKEIRVDRNLKETVKTTEVEGEITDIDLNGTYYLSIDNVKYRLSKDAVVKFNGKSQLSDLEIGFEVVAVLKDNVIVEIEVTEVPEVHVKGIIKAISNRSITLIVNGKEVSYDLYKAVDVEIDGEEDKLDNLVVGMEAKLTIKKDVVYEIDADTKETTFEGKINAITKTKNGYQLNLLVGKVENTYDVSDDVVILFDDDDETEQDMEDLEIGQKGKFYTVNGIITKIVIED